MEKGNCTQNAKKWFYDHKAKHCRQFDFTGCNGNENRFETRHQCTEICESPRRRGAFFVWLFFRFSVLSKFSFTQKINTFTPNSKVSLLSIEQIRWIKHLFSTQKGFTTIKMDFTKSIGTIIIKYETKFKILIILTSLSRKWKVVGLKLFYH